MMTSLFYYSIKKTTYIMEKQKYLSPTVEIYEVVVEKGFAGSGDPEPSDYEYGGWL